MKKNIVVLDGQTTNPGDLNWNGLNEIGNLTVYQATANEDIVKRAINADIIISNKCRLSAEIFEQLPKLKFISLLSTGFNLVDIDSARKHNILISNAPSYSTKMVAQHTFALILGLINQVEWHYEQAKKGEWAPAQNGINRQLPFIELNNKTIGIIGYGQIGKEVAKIAKAFNMKVLAYSRSAKDDTIATAASCDQLLTQSDIVSIHCPFNKETDNLIDATALSKMKSNAYLINTARGAIVNESDLYIALKDRVIRAAGLDVLAIEPSSDTNPLFKLNNCLITPHIAWAGVETRARLIELVVDNVKQYLNDEAQNLVT